MKILLLSDTHGSVHPEIVRLSRRYNYVLHAGDVGSAAVLAALRPRRALIAVRGNNDVVAKWPSGEQSHLRTLPLENKLQLPGGLVVVVHGDRHGPPKTRHARLRRNYPEARCVVYGHSHHLVCDSSELPWIINPGAGGRARTFGGASCIVLDTRLAEWKLDVKRFRD